MSDQCHEPCPQVDGDSSGPSGNHHTSSGIHLSQFEEKDATGCKTAFGYKP